MDKKKLREIPPIIFFFLLLSLNIFSFRLFYLTASRRKENIFSVSVRFFFFFFLMWRRRKEDVELPKRQYIESTCFFLPLSRLPLIHLFTLCHKIQCKQTKYSFLFPFSMLVLLLLLFQYHKFPPHFSFPIINEE